MDSNWVKKYIEKANPTFVTGNRGNPEKPNQMHLLFSISVPIRFTFHSFARYLSVAHSRPLDLNCFSLSVNLFDKPNHIQSKYILNTFVYIRTLVVPR